MTSEGRAERRLVTCLFIDVVGSTDLTVRLGPERMKRDLDRSFGELRDILQGHGGTIEKYIGDAIFVLFGAPVTHIDDPVRALRAASACIEWARTQGTVHGVSVRIGVESGEALIDLAGIEVQQRMAVGSVVNVAARLQAQADPGTVLVGPACREATANVAEFSAEREIDLKGLGRLSVATFAGITTQVHEPAPFVGRGEELTELGVAVARARAGRATFALVSGPPGQGKTRLSQELLGTLTAEIRVLTARCRPGTEAGAATPLWQLVAADAGEGTVSGLARRLTELFDEPGMRDGTFEVVAHASGLQTSDRLLALPAAQRRDAFHEAWRRYVRAIADDGPLVIWVEDLHWAEPLFVGLLDRLTSRSETRLLVLGTARPEFLGSASLRPSDDLVHVELGPLAPEEALALARTSSASAERTVERAEGNPLFIVELARARRLGSELPMTVHAAIAARIDELPPADRQLIQLAAVAGETFGVRDAALLCERDAADTAGALARLAHGLYLSPVDGRYRFHHALVRDVAYGRVPVADRMRLHARYAREGADPDDAEALAHHWWEALRPPDAEWVWEGSSDLAAMRREALEAHLVAGRRHADRLSHERAIELYTRALALSDGPIDVGRVEQGIGWAYARNGQGDEAWTHRQRALDAYGAAGGAPAALYADMLLIPVMNWGYFLKLPTAERVHELLAEGEGAARRQGDEDSLIRLLALRANFAFDPRLADEAIERVEASDDPRRLADIYRIVGGAQAMSGDAARAEATFRRMEELVAEGGDANRAEALMWWAQARLFRGDLAGAAENADQLVELARTASVHTKGHALAVSGAVLAARGDWEGVRRTAQEVERLVTANPTLGFCLMPASVTAGGAVAARLAGGPYPEGTERLVRRMVPEQTSVWASLLVVPRVMSGLPAFGTDLDHAYTTGPLWSRNLADPLAINPAIARVIAGRWDEVEADLRRLDDRAAAGSVLAAALAAAIREELAAAHGGPAPLHTELHELGYHGVSEMLRFRPA